MRPRSPMSVVVVRVALQLLAIVNKYQVRLGLSILGGLAALNWVKTSVLNQGRRLRAWWREVPLALEDMYMPPQVQDPRDFRQQGRMALYIDAIIHLVLLGGQLMEGRPATHPHCIWHFHEKAISPSQPIRRRMPLRTRRGSLSYFNRQSLAPHPSPVLQIVTPATLSLMDGKPSL